jgi:O-antigen/teichoic acid export membrane protein
MSGAKLLAFQTALSWGLIVVELLSGFFLAPVLLKALGPVAYGAWVIMNSTTALMGLVDLGLRGTQYRFVCMHAGDPSNQIRQAGLLYKVLLMLAGLAALGSCVSGWALPIFFPDLASTNSWDFFLGMLILGLTHAIAFTGSASGAFLAAGNQLHLNSVAGLIATSLRLSIGIWVAYRFPSLTNLALVSLAAALVQTGLAYMWATRRASPLALLREAAPLKDLREHLSHGAFSFSTRTLATVYQELPMYAALALNGAAAVTALSFCFLLVGSGRKLIDALGHNLSPRILKAASVRDLDALERLFSLLLTFCFVFGGLLSAGIYFYGPEFLRIWLRPQIFSEDRTLKVLALSMIVLPVGGIVAFFLDGMGKYWRNAKLALIESALGVVAVFTLGQSETLGLLGIAIGFVLPRMVFALVFAYLFSREIGMKLSKLVSMALSRFFFAALAYAVCGVGVQFLPPTDWMSLIVSVTSVSLSYGLICYRPLLALAREFRS